MVFVYPKRINYSLFLVCIGLLLTACSKPKEVLNRKQMENLMYDIYLVEALIEQDYQNFNTPEKKEALINEVFKKHKIIQAQWDTSLAWYSDRVNIYLRMNDSVRSRLKLREDVLSKQLIAQNNSQQAITEQLYSKSFIPSVYGFDTYFPPLGFKFKLDSTLIAQSITDSIFQFRFKVMGIPEDRKPDLKSFLALEYSDTTIYRFEKITQNTAYTLPGEKYIAGDTLKNIAGYVKLQDTTGYFKQIKLYDILLGSPAQHTDKEQPEPFEEATERPIADETPL